MAGPFQQYGRELLERGYLIIPIKPHDKRPALDAWQHARLSCQDIARFPGAGLGVLTGQGEHPVAAFDVDTSDAQLAKRFVNWCFDHLGMTCERVGKAPKVLLPYRAAESWPKATGAWFEDLVGGRHRLEVLGRGQQFVAYAIHPDTGKPYQWVDLLGGLTEMHASELPVVTKAQIETALQVFEHLATDCGLIKARGASPARQESAGGGDPLLFDPPCGLSRAEVEELLQYVDAYDYEAWLRVGMSLHHEFGGSDEGLHLWNAWSANFPNYQSFDDLAHRWEGFGRGGQRPTTLRWLIKIGNENKRETVRAEKRSARDESRADIEACADSFELLGDVARRAALAAGEDSAIKAELTGLIQKRFRALTGTSLPIGEIRRAMAGPLRTPGKRARHAFTEMGNAMRMLDRYGAGLMYVPEVDGWYCWTGVYWRRAAGVELEHLAKETIRGLLDEIDELEDSEREPFFKFCSISQRAAMVNNMVRLASSEPSVVAPVYELDKHLHLLGVANGAVDLTTGQLLPPTPAHRITTISDVAYDPRAKCPIFEATVRDVFFGDEHMINFFQRLVGYSLMGKPDEDVLVIPYGTGCNGKSTVFGAIREALGGHARTAQAETFLTSGPGASSAGSAREDVLRLRGSRFVYVGEPDEGSELREGLIKSMTGGDPIPARGLYAKSTVEVVPTWVVVMPTNHRPVVKGDDHAIWRRLLLVPFTRNFDTDPDVAKDGNRSEKLRGELSGILRWCVDGALAYQSEGLRMPSAVRDARDEYKRDMDLLAEWIEERCDVGSDCRDTSSRLWASWEAFARSRGELQYIRSAKALGRRLAARFKPYKNGSGQREMLGIQLKDSGGLV